MVVILLSSTMGVVMILVFGFKVLVICKNLEKDLLKLDVILVIVAVLAGFSDSFLIFGEEQEKFSVCIEVEM